MLRKCYLEFILKGLRGRFLNIQELSSGFFWEFDMKGVKNNSYDAWFTAIS